MASFRFWPTVRILTLGDSITAQTGDASYQARLLERLARLSTAEVAFFFVGQINGPPPIYHEGHAGFTLVNLNTNVAAYLTANPPDIVCILAGINDIIADATGATCATRMTTLLTTIFGALPTIQIVIARIPGLATTHVSYSAQRETERQNYNAALPGVVDGFLNRHLSLVDCSTGYNPETMHSDGIHPNAIGAKFLADRFCEDGYGRRVRDIKANEHV